MNVPMDDRFQVISEHEATDLVIDPTYLGISQVRERYRDPGNAQ